jgi:two-component system sensor histidine kinase VanS
MSVRTRFTFAYAALLAGTGSALIALFYAYVQISGLATVGVRPEQVNGKAVPPTISNDLPAGPTPFGDAVFLGLVILVIAIAMWIGWVIAGRLLRPLRTINEAALRVTGGDLDHRVGRIRPADEFANLGHVFDAMLDQIQQSIGAHRRFAANASHELRTPLATNRAMLTLALDDPADTDFMELTRRLHDTNEHSIATVEALLDLSDIGQESISAEHADLAELARALLEQTCHEAEAREITIIDTLEPALTTGAPILLTRLIANLLQNAVRHNLDGGHITIQTGHRGDRAYIAVSNTGAVIPADITSALLEPFSRRTSRLSEGGHGLGLAIVASIAAAHGARLNLSPRVDGGLEIEAVFDRTIPS